MVPQFSIRIDGRFTPEFRALICEVRSSKCSSENTAVFCTMPHSLPVKQLLENSANPQFWPANCKVDS